MQNIRTVSYNVVYIMFFVVCNRIIDKKIYLILAYIAFELLRVYTIVNNTEKKHVLAFQIFPFNILNMFVAFKMAFWILFFEFLYVVFGFG